MIDNTKPSIKQLDLIDDIEQQLGIKWNGKTRKDAIFFIHSNIGKLRDIRDGICDEEDI
jgi:hypothetical protein